MWTRPALQVDDGPAERRVSSCRSRRSRPRAPTGTTPSTSCCGTGSRSTASRRRSRRRSDRPGRVLHRAPRAAQGARRAARRVANASTATRCCGSAAPDRRPRSCARRRTTKSVEWLGAVTDARARLAAARRHRVLRAVVARRVVRRRAARGDGRAARRSSRRRSRDTATSPAPTSTRCWSRPATSARCERAASRLRRPGAARPARGGGPGPRPRSSRWRRLAERYLELYELALVPAR